MVSSMPFLFVVLLLFGSIATLGVVAATEEVCSAEDESYRGTQACEDEDERCAGWAKLEECDKNPGCEFYDGFLGAKPTKAVWSILDFDGLILCLVFSFDLQLCTYVADEVARYVLIKCRCFSFFVVGVCYILRPCSNLPL